MQIVFKPNPHSFASGRGYLYADVFVGRPMQGSVETGLFMSDPSRTYERLRLGETVTFELVEVATEPTAAGRDGLSQVTLAEPPGPVKSGLPAAIKEQ